MSIIDEMTARGRTNPLERDIYLAERILELSNLLGEQLVSVEIRLGNLERRLNAVAERPKL